MTRIRSLLLLPLLLFSFGLVAPALAQDGSAETSTDEAGPHEAWEPERLAEGRRVFLEAGNVGCSTCHGKFALGDVGVGPVIRGVDEVRIRGALEAAEEMGFLLPILTQQDIADVAYYLAYLDTLHPVKTLYRRERFDPERVSVPPDTDVQLIVENGNRSACDLRVEGFTDDPATIEGRDVGGVTFRSPAEGTLSAFCAEAPDAALAIDVEAPAEP